MAFIAIYVGKAMYPFLPATSDPARTRCLQFSLHVALQFCDSELINEQSFLPTVRGFCHFLVDCFQLINNFDKNM